MWEKFKSGWLQANNPPNAFFNSKDVFNIDSRKIVLQIVQCRGNGQDYYYVMKGQHQKSGGIQWEIWNKRLIYEDAQKLYDSLLMEYDFSAFIENYVG